MYNQSEYLMSYALVAAFVVLGMLVVCIPRPRKAKYLTKRTVGQRKDPESQRESQSQGPEGCCQTTKKESQKEIGPGSIPQYVVGVAKTSECLRKT